MDARILTSWNPHILTWDSLRAGFTEVLRKLGVESYVKHTWSVDIRNPGSHQHFDDDSSAMIWHQDGTGKMLISPFAADNYVVCWSNTMPTLIQDRKGNIMQGEPGDVVIFDNKTCLHRGPNGINAPDVKRWFIRTHLAKNEKTTALLKGTIETKHERKSDN